MVVVPVDDDDPLVPVDLLRIPGRDRRVGVVAETLFGPGVVRVVPGGRTAQNAFRTVPSATASTAVRAPDTASSATSAVTPSWRTEST